MENAVRPLGKYHWASYRSLTINGVTKHVSEWAREIGITPEGLTYRIKKGLKDGELISGVSVTAPKTFGRPVGSKNQGGTWVEPQVNPPTENSPLTDGAPAPH